MATTRRTAPKVRLGNRSNVDRNVRFVPTAKLDPSQITDRRGENAGNRKAPDIARGIRKANPAGNRQEDAQQARTTRQMSGERGSINQNGRYGEMVAQYQEGMRQDRQTSQMGGGRGSLNAPGRRTGGPGKNPRLDMGRTAGNRSQRAQDYREGQGKGRAAGLARQSPSTIGKASNAAKLGPQPGRRLPVPPAVKKAAPARSADGTARIAPQIMPRRSLRVDTTARATQGQTFSAPKRPVTTGAITSKIPQGPVATKPTSSANPTTAQAAASKAFKSLTGRAVSAAAQIPVRRTGLSR